MITRQMRNPVTWVVLVAVAAGTLVLLPATSLGARRKFTGACGGSGCAWTPTVRRIHRGDKIVWRVPAGDTTHTVTARKKGRNWSKDVTLAPGEKTTKRFRRKGVFYFKCTIHQGMNGKIRVRR
jgi:plastocyanin